MHRLFAMIVALSLAAAGAEAQALYRSNELGMELGPITPAQAQKQQWVLRVEQHGSVELRTLSDHGKEVTRWEDSYAGGLLSSEKVFKGGVLSSATEYRSGRPVREVEYSAGKKELVHDYTYSNGRLSSIAVRDAAGKLLYRDRYAEGRTGRLRRAVRELPDGKQNVLSFTYSGGHVVSEWLGSENAGVLRRYSDGSLVSKEEWKGTTLQQDEELLQGSGGRSTVTKDLATGTTTTKEYDASGKIVSERTTKKGAVVRAVDYTYAKGKITRKITKSPGRREEVRYEYGPKGILSKSETTVNRELVKVTRYSSTDSYVEDLYLNGEVVLHVYFEKGKKVKELAAGATGSEGAGSSGTTGVSGATGGTSSSGSDSGITGSSGG